MEGSSKTKRDQEKLYIENEKLKDEIEHLSRLLVRLDYESPPSIQAQLPAPAKGCGYLYILQENVVQNCRDNEPGFYYKLGVTTQSPSELIEKFQQGNPRKLALKRCEEVLNFEEAEKKLKNELKDWKIPETIGIGTWYLVPNKQRPHFYGKFYEALFGFGIEEPKDIPKGWLLFSNFPSQVGEDKVWIATGGILYHASKDCPVLVRKARNVYPIYKSKIFVHNRKPCRDCVFRAIKASRLSRSLSFNEKLLQK